MALGHLRLGGEGQLAEAADLPPLAELGPKSGVAVAEDEAGIRTLYQPDGVATMTCEVIGP